MAIEHVFRCDGPECERHVQTEQPAPPMFLSVTSHGDRRDLGSYHFCGWDCVLRYAAGKEPEQIITSPDSPSFD